ncbi:hypothetical protein AZA_83558 [Nitrospirillum viridazoti Y2]|nr:hypothetical protein AZA_83558 [Nitrospirillum amazonense Y2]
MGDHVLGGTRVRQFAAPYSQWTQLASGRIETATAGLDIAVAVHPRGRRHDRPTVPRSPYQGQDQVAPRRIMV